MSLLPSYYLAAENYFIADISWNLKWTYLATKKPVLLKYAHHWKANDNIDHLLLWLTFNIILILRAASSSTKIRSGYFHDISSFV